MFISCCWTTQPFQWNRKKKGHWPQTPPLIYWTCGEAFFTRTPQNGRISCSTSEWSGLMVTNTTTLVKQKALCDAAPPADRLVLNLSTFDPLNSRDYDRIYWLLLIICWTLVNNQSDWRPLHLQSTHTHTAVGVRLCVCQRLQTFPGVSRSFGAADTLWGGSWHLKAMCVWTVTSYSGHTHTG